MEQGIFRRIPGNFFAEHGNLSSTETRSQRSQHFNVAGRQGPLDVNGLVLGAHLRLLTIVRFIQQYA
jgi:hypothetical protein